MSLRLFLALLFLSLSSSGSLPSSLAQCLPAQSAALLRLEKGFRPAPAAVADSWRPGTDCCRGWAGVACDAAGRVIALDLSGLSISGHVDPSLFDLTSLQSLNLSCNNLSSPSPAFEKLSRLAHLNLSDSGFSGQVPAGIASLSGLLSLDLSTPGLCSESFLSLNEDFGLPRLIANLSNLRQLYLDGVNVSAGGPRWAAALATSSPNLRELSLFRCYLSGPIADSFSKLKSLEILRLNENKLNAEVPPFFAEFSSLRILRLSSCGLRGSLPSRIFHLPFLQTLDLSVNPSLSGTLPHFPPGMALQHLLLQSTNFSGSLPESIANLNLLKTLHLSGCRFSGDLPTSLQNLTDLVTVDLSFNNFSGPIPPLKSFSSLSKLDLQNNSLSGAFPSWVLLLPSLRSLQLNSNRLSGSLKEISLKQESQLETLDLSSNSLRGPIPRSLAQLHNLKILNLANNNLNGTQDLTLFGQLKNLSFLGLSYNKLTVQSKPAAAAVFQSLSTLNLASCGVTDFPQFLTHLPKLSWLDLSINEINGSIPRWLWTAGSLIHLNLSYNSLTELEISPDFSASRLNVLDLRSNNLQGAIPLLPQSNLVVDFSANNFISIPADIGSTLNFTIFFSVSGNSLTGEIPKSLCNGAYLQVLDLSHNSLAGEIPGCLVAASNALQVLNLRRNHLSGSLPLAFPAGNCQLRSLNLNGNNLRGKVPQTLKNCPNLEVLDLGNNRIEDEFPFWLGDLSNLRVLVLRANGFFGPVGRSSGFSMLRIMDLSSNAFNGSLPGEWFQSWKAMRAADEVSSGGKMFVAFGFLSGLYYEDSVAVTSKGLELTLVKILTVFASLDLSDNDFEGRIPPTAMELKALHALNVSRNRLTGPIPSEIRDLGMLESLDFSRNELSGAIPPGLASLSFLSFLNLSYNRLSGAIPNGEQLQTFREDSFRGNEGLCGGPLPKPCGKFSDAMYGASSAAGGFNWGFISVGLGFGGGMALVFGTLFLWGEARRWFEEKLDRRLLAFLPPAILLLCGFRFNFKVDTAESSEEEGGVEEEGREDGEKRFCVFCTRLEFRGQKVVVFHGPCSCGKEI